MMDFLAYVIGNFLFYYGVIFFTCVFLLWAGFYTHLWIVLRNDKKEWERKRSLERVIDISEQEGLIRFYENNKLLKSFPVEADIMLMINELKKEFPSTHDVSFRLPNGKVL